MGYMRHHAIVVTSAFEERLKLAYEFAIECNEVVTPVTDKTMNSYQSFAVMPDGSKEGWTESEIGDRGRDMFIAWLCLQEGGYLAWTEVQFGDDNRETKICRHSDE